MARLATLTIPAGKVASTLTDFVVRVDLADLSSYWWADVASGGANIRVKQGGSVIPFDVVSVNTTSRTGNAFFKATLTTGATVVTVETVDGATALAATDPNGRNAVWADYAFVLDGSDYLVNRVGANNPAVTSTLPLIGPVAKTGDTDSHQGVAVDGNGNFYTFDDDEIIKWNSSWVEIDRATTPLADSGISGVNHIGDGCVIGNEIFNVVENYPSGPYVNQHICVWDLDLNFLRSYNISAQGHEVSSICLNPVDGYLYITNYESAGDSLLYKYQTDGTYVGTLALSAAITKKQGIAYWDGYFWITSDPISSSKAIYRVDPSTGTVTRAAGAYLSNNTSDHLEGITADADHLYVMYEASNTQAVWTYVRQGWGGYVFFDVTGYLKATGIAKLTQWTLGVTSLLSKSAASNRALVSYGTNNTTDANRATIAASNSQAKYSAWNSTDSWLNDTGGTPAALEKTRLHHTFNGTTDRKLWRDGVLVATDLVVSQRPASTGDTLFVGAEDTSNAEGNFGGERFIYLRNGVLSGDWLAAEFASWENPQSFYSVVVATPVAGGVDVAFPPLGFDASGSVATAGALEASFPALTVEGSGTYADPVPDFQVEFPRFDFDASGDVAQAGVLDVSFPAFDVEAEGMTDVNAGHLIASFPSFRVAAAGLTSGVVTTPTMNQLEGRIRGGLALVETDVAPSYFPTGHDYDATWSLDTPDLIDGRPT